MGADRPVQPARDHHRIDARAAGPGRCGRGARRAGAAGLWRDRDQPDRDLHPPRRRSVAAGIDRPARTAVRGAHGRRGGREVPHGIAGEVVVRGPNVLIEYWRNDGRDRRGAARRLVPHRRHRHARRGRLFHHPRPQEEHDRVGRREYLSGGNRARAAGASAVAEAAVIGVRRSALAGSAGRLRRARAGRGRRRELRAHPAAAQLARFKVPREIVFVDDLPRNALGKVQHFRLKEAENRRLERIPIGSNCECALDFSILRMFYSENRFPLFRNMR